METGGGSKQKCDRGGKEKKKNAEGARRGGGRGSSNKKTTDGGGGKREISKRTLKVKERGGRERKGENANGKKRGKLGVPLTEKNENQESLRKTGIKPHSSKYWS